ncbi:uncharacterized protein [Phaseolus vulgaris]
MASLRLIASQIGNDPFPVPWDNTFFQINTELPLMIYNTDLSEFISGNQELNISIIQFFMMFLHRVCITEGKENMYGFVDPAYTNPVGPNSTETQAYITNILEKEGKQIYLCPYINEHHWQLLVLSMVDKTAVWFCSLHKKMPTKFKDIIDT